MGAAIPIISGVSALAGLSNAARDQRRADRNESKYNGQADLQYQQQQALLEKLMPSLDQLIQFSQETPYATNAADPYGAKANDARYSGYAEQTATGYRNAAEALGLDEADRGVTGSSDPYRAGLANSLGSNLAGFRRDLSVQSEQEKYDRANKAEDARFTRLSALVNPLMNIQGNVSQGIGGQQTMSQLGASNAAAASQQNLGQLGEILAGVDWGAMGKSRGNNTAGTNQVGNSNQIVTPQITNGLGVGNQQSIGDMLTSYFGQNTQGTPNLNTPLGGTQHQIQPTTIDYNLGVARRPKGGYRL